MKKYKKIIYAIIIFLALAIIKETYVNAASASISTSGTGTVNTPISVSVSGTAAQWNLKLIVDGKVVATSSELDSVDNKAISFSGSYTPTSAGAKNVTIEGTITDADGTTTRSFGSKTITVAEKTVEPATKENDNTAVSQEENKPAEATKESTQAPASTQTSSTSSNASLSNLGIYTYDFTGFKPDTTTYNTTVPNNVTSVQVYAVPKDGAVYHVTGNTNLDVGTNKVTITVTSADKKTTKNYYIYVARKESEGEEKTTKEEEIVPNVVEEKKDETQKLALISIAIDEKVEVSLEPEFKPEIFEYTINYKGDLETIPLNAIANKEGSKVEITGNEKLKDGENTILITVTNGEEKAEYKIKVKKNIDKVKQEEKKEETEKKETNIQAKPKKEENKSMIWYIVGGAGGLALLILIIIIVKHKKSDDDDDDFMDDNTERNRFNYKEIELEKEENSKYDTSKYEEKHSKRSKKGKHF